jgi:hypothetical protein
MKTVANTTLPSQSLSKPYSWHKNEKKAKLHPRTWHSDGRPGGGHDIFVNAWEVQGAAAKIEMISCALPERTPSYGAP